ncbi:MAG: LysM peptidoglycan-binding domain-containing protein [Jatrophihabitantaceae bacterium]
MSVATEFAPVVYIPPPARPRDDHCTTVAVLFAPGERSVATPLRLTRRGIRVVALTVALLAAALVAIAWASAPGARPAGAPAPASVTVRSGDTLWSIATRVAPDRDPRAEVADLQRRNHLDSVALHPGQILRTR